MKSIQALGQERFKSDKRQLGGLLMLIGVYILHSPMAKLVILVGPNGTTANEGIPFSGLTGSILIIFMGLKPWWSRMSSESMAKTSWEEDAQSPT
jgi:hypothetical protein